MTPSNPGVDSKVSGLPLISSSELNVALDGSPVLFDLDFSVPSGSLTAVIGPNGCGKTTLLRTIGKLVEYRGSLLLDGREVSRWRRVDFARRVASVRSASAIAFDFRVLDLVLLSRAVRKGWLQPFDLKDRRAAMNALTSVDLDGFEQRSIHSLSSGEQQRVFLAQAIAQEPDVLLLDEPTSHLDIHHQFSFMDRVRAFVNSGGTALAAIHDLELACRYADNLMILQLGRLVAQGPPGFVLSNRIVEEVFCVRAEVTAEGERVENVKYFGSVS